MSRTSPDSASVRRLDGGEVVVDYGLTWYRVNLDGSIIRKDASTSGVSRRNATALECKKVNKAISEAGL